MQFCVGNHRCIFDSVREQRKQIIFEKGMNPKGVQAIMGHQHYSTTIEMYTHVTEQKFDDDKVKFGCAITEVVTIPLN